MFFNTPTAASLVRCTLFNAWIIAGGLSPNIAITTPSVTMPTRPGPHRDDHFAWPGNVYRYIITVTTGVIMNTTDG